MANLAVPACCVTGGAAQAQLAVLTCCVSCGPEVVALAAELRRPCVVHAVRCCGPLLDAPERQRSIWPWWRPEASTGFGNSISSVGIVPQADC